MEALNRVYQNDPSKAPKIVFVMKGTFHIYANNPRVNINYPMIMIGAGQNKTNLSGYCLRIGGTKEKGKNVRMQDITMVRSSGDGLYGYNGLFFLCTRMTFTQCGGDGVRAYNTKGRLINCVITQCRNSGIFSSTNALIELEGDQTKVDGNNASGDGYGLETYSTSSIIHLLFPLTKESVSTNNGGDGNYGGGGTIQTVNSF